jgi:hypothetical protein
MAEKAVERNPKTAAGGGPVQKSDWLEVRTAGWAR